MTAEKPEGDVARVTHWYRSIRIPTGRRTWRTLGFGWSGREFYWHCLRGIRVRAARQSAQAASQPSNPET
jgi:hypothetical protein